MIHLARRVRAQLLAVLLFAACRPHVAAPVATAPAAEPPLTATSPTAPGRAATPAPTAGSVRRPSATLSFPVRPLVSNSAPTIAREFRGVWVATVANIDWPSSRKLSTAAQQRELVALLDRAAALKLNAVLFQVRPAADALYASKIEPWSEYLTGAQGRAPDPYWDPLEFAVREAHARNLELHAWFNPYRARNDDARSPLAKTHIALTDPALVKKYAGFLWMDPGELRVRERTLAVVLDVVKRYDIDGVHIDDYFYPYPEHTRRGRPILFPDERSWARYKSGGGNLTRADWRRSNVDALVHELDVGVHKTKPWVKFGVSPFGIWRPGFPSQVRGLDAYSELYADGRKWLREGWVDYFSPQLYWPTTKPEQPYGALLDWWVGENKQARHMWPGNFTSRAGGSGRSDFSVAELVEQIRVTRSRPGSTGNVHFSMKSFLVNQAKMNDALVAGPYASQALVPSSPWLDASVAPTPLPGLVGTERADTLLLSTAGKMPPWQWVVQLRTDTAWVSVLLPGYTSVWPVPAGLSPTVISVTAINRTGAESPPVRVTVAPARPSTSAPAKRGREHED